MIATPSLAAISGWLIIYWASPHLGPFWVFLANSCASCRKKFPVKEYLEHCLEYPLNLCQT